MAHEGSGHQPTRRLDRIEIEVDRLIGEIELFARERRQIQLSDLCLDGATVEALWIRKRDEAYD